MTPVCAAANEIGVTPRTSWFSTRAQIALTACACGSATAFLYAVDPNHHSVYPQCLLYNATGIYCAGCGATRAIYALLHGRILEALHDNALLIALLPLILYVTVSHASAAWKANAWPQIPVDTRKLVWRGGMLFALMIAFMLARNLSGWPFDWLKPIAA